MQFLKNYTIPFVQLNPIKTILVVSHSLNTFDKTQVLNNSNEFMQESNKSINDFIKEPEMIKFYIDNLDNLLSKYK